MDQGCISQGRTMIEVVIAKQTANSIIDIVHNLRDQGFIQGVDFEFAYHAADYDNWSGDVTYNRHTVFRFKDPAVASWFTLKYEQ